MRDFFLTFPAVLFLAAADESKQRRNDLSLRDAPVGSNKVAFRKPNQATDGLVLGLKFREDWSKAVFIDKIVPGTEAASLQARGKINEGDEVTMVSATFGDEMWSARGIGKYRLEKSIAVRQGATIAFVFENKKKDRPNQAQIQKEKDRMSRMQQQLAKEVDANKSKKQGGLFGGLFD